MDGFESTAKIRDHERSSNLRRVNIAALTSVTSSEARTRAKDADVNVLVTKPIRMKDLTDMVSEIRAGKGFTLFHSNAFRHDAQNTYQVRESSSGLPRHSRPALPRSISRKFGPWYSKHC